jgi:peptidoglycan/LPS O-acetylase OafA/YrhL
VLGEGRKALSPSAQLFDRNPLMAGSGSEHSPEIDRTKGIAILFVIAIHAKIGEGSAVHEQLVNRAVPIFLFVFGMMSDLSYRRAVAAGRSIKDWYLARLKRLYLPVWGMGLLYWMAVIYTKKPPLPIGGWHALLTFFGYSPWIGPSWFVTLVIQLVLVFPALSWVVDKIGPWIALVLAAVITAVSLWYSLDILDFGLQKISRNVPPPGWFYIWTFLPRSMWLVICGMVVARHWGTKLRLSVTLAAVVIGLFAETAIYLVNPDEFIAGPLRKLIVMHLWDVPIALGVLGVMGNLPLPATVAKALEWCGRWSWGLYLGHIVVFEAAHMIGKFPEAGTTWRRVEYGLFLLWAGAMLALGGDALRRMALLKLRSDTPTKLTT